jgi:hypothetical protein
MKSPRKLRKLTAVQIQRFLRKNPKIQRCDCGGNAVKFSHGFVCQRCLDIESGKMGDFNKKFCGFGGSGGMAE